MKKRPLTKSFLLKVVYFFPLQLLFVHFKKNQQLLLFWLLLFLTIFQQIGNKYGVPLLFLEPEYLGELSIWSYGIVGFALGSFVMAFNISSYIMNGFRFPFLATLSKPFFKYCINNSFLPLLFILTYLYCTYNFLDQYESYSRTEIIKFLAGFIAGYIIFVSISMLYFMATNKDLEKLFGKELAKVMGSDTDGEEPARLLLHKKERNWYNKEVLEKTWRVESYIGSRFRLKATRPFSHYDYEMLTKVFRQNHVNASFFEIAVIISILALGWFREVDAFIIPAGSTIIMVITMALMASSALRSWLRGWTLLVILVFFVGLNQLSKYDSYYFENRLYGLKYDNPVTYDNEQLIVSDEAVKQDIKSTKKQLSNWKKSKDKKPKAVFIATSGGGSRAMLWSMIALQHLDSITSGKLYNHTLLNTGSSGGMIGSAYYRELALQDKINGTQDRFQKKYAANMERDLLNPVFFTLAVNDMLIRTGRFDYNSDTYWKDRGYAFENSLNQITNKLLDKPLSYYNKPVSEGLIPMMIFSPSIINDGRRMLISSQRISYICQAAHSKIFDTENVEYLSLFEKNQAENIRFLSVLRANASFPYIMPTVSLPTDPKLEIFDSGMRDNYGIKTTVKFIYELKDWLEINTSGIIILQIRDGLKDITIAHTNTKRSIASEMLSPFGSLYGNLFQIQDYNNDELLEYTTSWYNGPVEILNYQLNKSKKQNISLSWHLTAKEKRLIFSSIQMPQNKEVEDKLKELLQ